MEQIKNGMLELMKHITATQMMAGKVDTASGSESEFSKLLAEKNTEAKPESAPEKKETTDSPQQTEQKTKESEKVEGEKKSDKPEEETCDVAREAACAQMVWLVPQTTDVQQTAEETVVSEIVSEEVVQLTPVVENETVSVETEQVLQGENMVQQENTQAVETELAPQETVESAEEAVHAPVVSDEAEQVVARPENENKIEVKVETDENGGEAAVVEAPLFKDVEAAPIKVADAPAETEAGDVAGQISEKLTGALETGESKVEIQLTPEALGKVTVELTRSADGTLSILLNAENAQTRELLSRHVNTLQEAIVDRGQQNVQIEVNRGEDAQRQNDTQQDLQDGRNGNQPEQQRRNRESSSEDFLQQLRLGLIDIQEDS